MLDSLLKELPKDLQVHLVRNRFYQALSKSKKRSDEKQAAARRKAADELKAALDLAPHDIDVLIPAAQEAMASGDLQSAQKIYRRHP